MPAAPSPIVARSSSRSAEARCPVSRTPRWRIALPVTRAPLKALRSCRLPPWVQCAARPRRDSRGNSCSSPVAWELLRCSNKQSRRGCTMEIGVFIPIGNNGWLISSTSPQYTPSFDLNRDVVLRAERYGFDFALSMITLRGFGGKSRYWDDNLESFTLMAGLASITSRIELYATVAV